MRIDRNTYGEYFTKYALPSWNCPICNRGTVGLNISKLQTSETKQSITDREDEAWELSWVKQHFICTASCHNSKCKENYSIAGIVDTVEEVDEEHGLVYEERYYPKFIFPILHLFTLPESTPYEVEEALLNSFKLYWIDTSACANAIRRTAELILTDKKIIRVKLSKHNKRVQLNLHQRIELFKDKYPDAANWLMAIKWIGNAGSHTAEVYSEDLLNAFDLLRHVLYRLYSNHDKEIESMAKSINKRRKP